LIAPGFGTYKVKFTKGNLEATVTLESHLKPFAGTVVTLRGEEKKPNLVIESISSSLQNPKIGDKIKFTVKTKNKGDGDADHGFYIYYYINGDKKDSDYVSSLSAGRTKTTYF
jgi:subtilase family serine protease